MFVKEFSGINSFLIEMAQLLLKESVKRNVRGLVAYELPSPIIVKFSNPLARLITIKERKWNYVLPYVESLWLASGRNDMEMIGYYVKRMYDFSDDNISMRAGYGPRLRFFNGKSDDYSISFEKNNTTEKHNLSQVDQFKYIEKCFQKDQYTRQAIISITDPAKDHLTLDGELKLTKDFPCTNNIQFLRTSKGLDVMVHMRSNDFMWGASGVNIFNYTFMQEYFSQILGLPIGDYYHIVNNLHFYESFMPKIEQLANASHVSDDFYIYKRNFNNLKEFDQKISSLEKYEASLRKEKVDFIIDLGDEFFNDWAKVLYSFHFPKSKIIFLNPLLNEVFEEKRKLIRQAFH